MAGLALNNENVTFATEYKKILRFYGFDLDRDQLPTLSPQSNHTESNETITATLSTPEDISTVTMPGLPAREDTTSTTEVLKEDTTVISNAETFTNVDVREPTTVAPLLVNAEKATMSSINAIGSAASAITENVQPDELTTPSKTTGAGTAATNEITMTTAQETMANDFETVGAPETTATSASISNNVETTIILNDASAESTSNVTTEPQPTDLVTPEVTTTTNMDTTINISNDTGLETLQRKKKSVADFIFTNSPPYVDDYLIYRAYEIPAELPKPSGGDSMFLVNGLRIAQVKFYCSCHRIYLLSRNI